MAKPMTAFAIALTSLLALSGCGTSILSVLPEYNTSGLDSKFDYAANRQEVFTEIQGNPFDESLISQKSLDDKVLRSMGPGAGTPRPDFTDTSSAATHDNLRMAIVMNSPILPTGNELCTRPINDFGYIPKSGNVRVDAAFCDGPNAVSKTTVIGGNIVSPDDPAFSDLMETVRTNLLPTQAFTHGSCSSGNPALCSGA